MRLLWRRERRLDGEAYLTGGFTLREEFAALAACDTFGELAEVFQPGRLKAIQVARGHGTPYLTAGQAFDLRPNARKWIAPIRMAQFEKCLVEQGWIVVTRSGTVGEPLLTYSAHDGVVVSDDLLRVVPNDSGRTGFLYAFLKTRHAKTMLRSSKYGSIVKHLEPEHMISVPVPRPRPDVVAQCSDSVAKIYDLRDQALRLSIAAEAAYAAAIGYAVEGGDELTFTGPVRRMSVGARRLDAHHFNPAAYAALAAIEASAPSVERVRDVTQAVFGVPRFKHVYGSDGIPYLDSEDLFRVNPEITKFIPEATKKNPRSYFVEAGQVLMAVSGQIYGLNGSVVLANQRHEQKIISNHIVRIVADERIRSGYLHTVLGHPRLGRPIVTRLAFGSSVPEVAPHDILNIPVPRLQPHVEDEIAELAETASQCRCEADDLEDEVVREVEAWLDALLHGSTAG